MGNIKKCEACNTYTLQDACPRCEADTTDPEPPAFSYPDRYGEYRRAEKRKTQGDT